MKRKLPIVILFFATSVSLGQIIKTYQYQVNDGYTSLFQKNDTVKIFGNGGHIFMANLDTTTLDTLNTLYLNSTGLDVARPIIDNNTIYLHGIATGFSSGIWNLSMTRLGQNYYPQLTKSYKSTSSYPFLSAHCKKKASSFYYGFITKNYNTSFGPPWDVGILKLNHEFDTITHRIFDSGNEDEVKNIQVVSNRVFAFGITSSVDTLDFLFMKLDTSLNPVAIKAIGGGLEDGGSGLFYNQTSYLFGNTNSFGLSKKGIILMKLDTNGNVLKGVCYSSNVDIGFPTLKVINGRFLLFMRYDLPGCGICNNDCLFMEVDSNMNILDTFGIDFSSWEEYISDVIKISPNRYLFALASTYNTNDLKQVKLFTTDSAFTNSCLPTIPITINSMDVTSQIHSTSITMSSYQHQITVTTDTFEINRGFSSVTTDCVVGEKELDVGGLMFDVYPNPFSGSITFSAEIPGEYELTVFDVAGKLVEIIKFSGYSYNYGNAELTSGIYFYEIRREEKVIERGKIIKQR